MKVISKDGVYFARLEDETLTSYPAIEGATTELPVKEWLEIPVASAWKRIFQVFEDKDKKKQKYILIPRLTTTVESEKRTIAKIEKETEEIKDYTEEELEEARVYWMDYINSRFSELTDYQDADARKELGHSLIHKVHSDIKAAAIPSLATFASGMYRRDTLADELERYIIGKAEI